jgi:Ca2+-binding EF-hand superfamily protein
MGSPTNRQEERKKTTSEAEMKRELNMIFDIYDKDGDGRLNMVELRTMINTIYSRKTGKEGRFSRS